MSVGVAAPSRMKVAGRVAVIAAGLAAVFAVPYHLAPTGVISDAYMAGYSTRGALLIFCGFALCFAMWTRGSGLDLPREAPQSRLSRGLLGWTVGVAAVLASAIWVAVHMSGPFNDANYFADRYLMYGTGAKLYRDFEFPYGPLMFFGPLWVRRVTHLTLTDSYCAWWMVQWVAGVAVLWETVSLAAGGSRRARTIYLLLWGFVLVTVLAAGENYTPLRFSSTLLLALLAERAYRTKESALSAFAIATGGTMLLLLYSPEQAIALSAGTVAFFGLNFAPRRKGFLPGAAVFLLFAGASFALANHFGVLSSLKAFGGGGLALPLAISVQNIVLLLLLLVAACGLWSALAKGRRDHGLIYVCLVAGASAPAAFGRSDPGHMVLNLLGAVLTAMVVLMETKRAWTWAVWLFLLCFVMTWWPLSLYQGRGLVLNTMREAIERRGTEGSFLRRVYAAGMERAVGSDKTHARLATLNEGRENLPAGVEILAPFGTVHRAFDMDQGNEALSGRYSGLLPLMSVGQVDDKIRELQAHPEDPLLIPYGGEYQCRYDLQQERRSIVGVLLPLYMPQLRRPVTAAEPFCAYVREHYRPTTTGLAVEDSVLWVPVK